MNKSLSSLVLGFAFIGSACSSESGSGNQGGAPQGTAGASGGNLATGGAGGTIASGTGGATAGGKVGTGGATTTGGAATGGSGPVAGTVGSGGTPAQGGAPGGAPATGGAGGALTGGSVGTGGSTAGAGGLATTGGSGGGTTAPPEPTLITSGKNDYWVVGEVVEMSGSANVTVNESDMQQEWNGFGGTFNEMGWDALKELSEADRALAMRLLFDPVDGAGFTFGRIPIGASDYGLSRYTLAETANDFEMASFSIDRDLQDLIPYIKAAQDVKPDIRFWASPWTPPPWMKSNNAYDRGSMKNDAQTLGAHALYLARFVEEYATQGIVVEAIFPQNEPGYEQDYPSCAWSASQMADYIANHLGPLFEERLPNTQIWTGTHSNPNESAIVSAVMGNATARGFVTGIGLQWGMGDGDAPSQYASQYNVPVWQTEHKCGNYPWEGGDASRAPNDHAYAVESWGFFTNWIRKDVNAYMAWNMVLDTVGRSLDTVRPWAQNALLAVDRNMGTLIVTPTYYVFRHLAQYVEPGAVRLGTNGGDALAFRNPDGSIVTVLYNSTGSPAQTTLAVGGTTVQFTIPAQGWATVNWQG